MWEFLWGLSVIVFSLFRMKLNKILSKVAQITQEVLILCELYLFKRPQS